MPSNKKFILNIPEYNGIGIYALKNEQNGKMYIGSSKNIRKRILQHKNSPPSATKEDIQHGDTFTAMILEKLPYGSNQFYMFAREAYFIKKYNVLNEGYNTAKTTCSSKDDLLASLAHFSNSPKMCAYIKNIIRKREQPILPPCTLNQKPLSNQSELITIRVPKGHKAIIKAHAERQGESMNAFIVRSVNETMERDAPGSAATDTGQESNQ